MKLFSHSVSHAALASVIFSNGMGMNLSAEQINPPRDILMPERKAMRDHREIAVGQELAIRNETKRDLIISPVAPDVLVSPALRDMLINGSIGISATKFEGSEVTFEISYLFEGKKYVIGQRITLDTKKPNYLDERNDLIKDQLEKHAAHPPIVVCGSNEKFFAIDSVRSPHAYDFAKAGGLRFSECETIAQDVPRQIMVEYSSNEGEAKQRFATYSLGQSLFLEPIFDKNYEPKLNQIFFDGEYSQIKWGGRSSGFYCAHAQLIASIDGYYNPKTSILHDRAGDPLVTFLHISSDKESHEKRPETRSTEALLKRHAPTIEAVGVVFAAYLASAVEAHPKDLDEIRVLITGYGSFSSIADNATGEFARSGATIGEMVRHYTQTNPKDIRTHENGIELSASVHDIAGFPTVKIRGLELPVNSSAIDGTEKSLPWHLSHYKPHIVISLGQESYFAPGKIIVRAHTQVDNASISKHESRYVRESSGLVTSLPPNKSLVRAMTLTGGRPLVPIVNLK